jgi:hypothetical protein
VIGFARSAATTAFQGREAVGNSTSRTAKGKATHGGAVRVVPVPKASAPLQQPSNGVGVGTRAGRCSRLPTGNEPLWADLGRTCHTSEHPKPGFKQGLGRQMSGHVFNEFQSLLRQTLGIDERASPNGFAWGHHYFGPTTLLVVLGSRERERDTPPCLPPVGSSRRSVISPAQPIRSDTMNA